MIKACECCDSSSNCSRIKIGEEIACSRVVNYNDGYKDAMREVRRYISKNLPTVIDGYTFGNGSSRSIPRDEFVMEMVDHITQKL